MCLWPPPSVALYFLPLRPICSHPFDLTCCLFSRLLQQHSSSSWSCNLSAKLNWACKLQSLLILPEKIGIIDAGRKQTIHNFYLWRLSWLRPWQCLTPRVMTSRHQERENVGGTRIPLGLSTTHCAAPLTSTATVEASCEVLSPGQKQQSVTCTSTRCSEHSNG